MLRSWNGRARSTGEGCLEIAHTPLELGEALVDRGPQFVVEPRFVLFVEEPGVVDVTVNPLVAAAPIPRTGTSSTIPLTSVALALLAAGGLFVLFARRRRVSHQPA